MKIVKEGHVYDIDQGGYDRICEIPTDTVVNAVGNRESVTSELRRDKVSGLFYLHMESRYCYGRGSHQVKPVTEDEAREIAERYVDYDEYVKFFKDPEGDAVGMKRELDKVTADLKEAKDAQGRWFQEYQNERNLRLALEEKVHAIEEKLAELKGDKEA